MIFESYPLFYAVFLLHYVLLIGAPVLLFRSGWPVTGGLISLASTVLPIAGQTWFTDSDMPGCGLLLMVEAPLAFLVLLIGVGLSATKLVQRRRSSAP